MRKTLKDVAKKAGVSTAVASRALGSYGYVSKEAREKVLKVAEKIGYQPDIIARSLMTRKTHTIGIIISDITTLFFTSAVRGIEDVARENGYNVILCNSDENLEKETEYLKVIYEKRVDGLIISMSAKSNSYLKKLIRGGLPVVLLDRGPKEIKATKVIVDNLSGAYEAVNHLIKLGRRRIGVINGIAGVTTSDERFEGYKRALKDNDILIDPELVKYGEFKMEKARQVAQQVIKMKNPPDALFVTNEVMTTGALLALNENNVRIPQEIAIVGFDDPVWAPLMKPPLTAVRQPSYSVGTIAFQTLLQIINKGDRGKTSEEEIVLKAKLIARGSCGEKLFKKRA